jgi:hypothetical protein
MGVFGVDEAGNIILADVKFDFEGGRVVLFIVDNLLLIVLLLRFSSLALPNTFLNNVITA